MARDEALLTTIGDGHAPPTFRLYQWSEPTISLGYFQHYADYTALTPPAGDLPVVRRLTGGGAILHDLELTYSLTLPTGHVLLGHQPNMLYERMHEAVIAALETCDQAPSVCGTSDDSGAARGPFFCFERRHRFDVLLGMDKIVGSAQRRTTKAVLQHGSIVLGNRFEQQLTAQVDRPFDQTAEEMRRLLMDQFQSVMDYQLTPGVWSDDEQHAADNLKEKYSGPDWTRRT